ncbi:SH3 domain-containing protein [Mucilaginibacter frigoritolerans]|uniref:SH3 domain-containing protein n=1 Tax=Mucilaginibacter frigoritolerans TaxID=652788 RepID=A0A562TXQ1_9SPHI|nr:C40 family peptidase [Mucilaginibacter frigoritolerans]TWI98038.1 SH3 domain-containing protein [Mucilaginibacter frigoritolerans]
MEYGICNLSVIPLRAEDNDRSEQVSQLLFGEIFEIVEWKANWVKIITTFDNYTGWIGRLQFIMIGHLAYKQFKETPPPLTYRPVTQALKTANNSILYLPMGSSLAFLEGTTCNIGTEKFEIIGEIGETESLVITASSYLNTPYLWGGRTHFGIDCSGFTQMVFRLKGVKLLRDASMQAEQGEKVDSVQNSKLGDLAFFDNAEGKIVHVGIILNTELIIHASGKVKIDTIDEKGIYSEELKRYTHKLRIIKRFL